PVVEVSGEQANRPRHASIRAAFDDMLERKASLLASPEPGVIDVLADLFVNDVKEERGWHGQLMAIAVSLEQNTDNRTMRELGAAIRFHADQTWAARHVDDSKRSG
ncbi:MAG: hypothetical protein PHY95_01515, partial [Candidatus ainarchaeum sp.]|nr:hypothetical protein [Candidatus ainarchaeum sp.]